jgi:hypothetical protein
MYEAAHTWKLVQFIVIGIRKQSDLIWNSGGQHDGDRRMRIAKLSIECMTNSTKSIERRDDTKPKYGEHKYGDVKFADATNKKYPIDTPEHVRAAWNYINHKDNAAKYDAGEAELIKTRIKKAAKHHDIEIRDE